MNCSKFILVCIAGNTIIPVIDDNSHTNSDPEIKAEGVLLEEKKDDIERLSQYTLSKFIIYFRKFFIPKLSELK